MKERKEDRRSKYTRMIIKDTFLELLKEKSYDKINVSQICKNAEITRTTFYLHYSNLDEVFFETLDEALEISKNSVKLEENKQINIFTDPSFTPLCQRTAVNPKYNVLFLDSILSDYIANKLFHCEKDFRIKQLQEKFGLTEFEAEKIYRFVFFGSFAVNKSLGWKKNEEWDKIQNLIREFIKNGISKK